jgi:anti-anti-sigma factor
VEIDESRFGDLIVLRPVGRLDNVTSAEFQAKLLRAITTGAAEIVVDLAAVDYVSSGGLRALVIAAKQKPADRRLAVAGLQARVQEIFTIAHLHHVIPVFATVREVALAWGSPNQPKDRRVRQTAVKHERRSRRL